MRIGRNSPTDCATVQAVKDACQGPNSDRAAILPVDVTASGDEMQRFAQAADSIHGGIDFVFLAAGPSTLPTTAAL